MAPQACRSFRVLGRNYLCSSHVALTRALSATAEEAGVGPGKTSGRNTFSLRSPSFPSSEVLWNGRATAYPVAETQAGLAVSLPRNSEHILFWSVGDLFTYRSRFLLPTNILQA